MRIDIESQFIEHVDYDEDINRAIVYYPDGTSRSYFDIPGSVIVEFLDSTNKDEFYMRVIKPYRHEH